MLEERKFDVSGINGCLLLFRQLPVVKSFRTEVLVCSKKHFLCNKDELVTSI